MAPPKEQDLEALKARIAASRIAVSADLAELRHKLDVPARVKHSIVKKPMSWLGGSLGAGFLASLVLKRRRKTTKEEVVKKSFWLVILGGIFSLARPLLQSWAVREFQNRFAGPYKYSQDKHL